MTPSIHTKDSREYCERIVKEYQSLRDREACCEKTSEYYLDAAYMNILKLWFLHKNYVRSSLLKMPTCMSYALLKALGHFDFIFL